MVGGGVNDTQFIILVRHVMLCVIVGFLLYYCRSCDVALGWQQACNAHIQASQNRTININIGRAK